MRAVGWDAACQLSEEEFSGWEVSFLAAALPIVEQHDRAAGVVDQARVFGLTRRT